MKTTSSKRVKTVMSRANFFRERGLTVHQIFNISELSPQILHETQRDSQDAEQNAIFICTGYKDVDGNYEYLLVSGMTHEELTPVIDENIRELRILDGDKAEIRPEVRERALELSQLNPLQLEDYTPLLKGERATIWRYMTSSFPYLSLTEHLQIKSKHVTLCFQKYGIPKYFDPIPETQFVHITNVTYLKRTTKETSWLGYDSKSVDYQVVIQHGVRKTTFWYDQVSRVETVEPVITL
jgi:hypothetical protein